MSALTRNDNDCDIAEIFGALLSKINARFLIVGGVGGGWGGGGGAGRSDAFFPLCECELDCMFTGTMVDGERRVRGEREKEIEMERETQGEREFKGEKGRNSLVYKSRFDF